MPAFSRKSLRFDDPSGYNREPLAMPHRLCPLCHQPGRLLESASDGARVEYYRCDACYHVWSHDQSDPDSAPEAVTTPKKPSKS